MREITLDWDLPFTHIQESILYDRTVQFCKERKFKMFIRKSSNGNVHVRIESPYVISIMECFEIRALLGDDKARLAVDLVRDYKGMEINRIWDKKFKHGKLMKAGSWHKVV